MSIPYYCFTYVLLQQSEIKKKQTSATTTTTATATHSARTEKCLALYRSVVACTIAEVYILFFIFISSFCLFCSFVWTRCTFKAANQPAYYQNPNHTIISCASYSDFKTAISWIACAKIEHVYVCLPEHTNTMEHSYLLWLHDFMYRRRRFSNVNLCMCMWVCFVL